MATPAEWSKAFAVQADADMRTFDRLCLDEKIPTCSRLHFLQMACEKLSKAHLFVTGGNPDRLQSSHAHIRHALPRILNHQIEEHGKIPKHHRHLVAPIKQIAREIELLAPSVRENGQRPDNCEYPWEDPATETLRVPAQYSFHNLSMVLESSPAWTAILKLLRSAIAELIGRGA